MLQGVNWKEVGHTALDVAGLIPGVGEIADGINALWYAAEGDWVNAALSAAGMIPALGAGVIAAKYANKVTNAAIDIAKRNGRDHIALGRSEIVREFARRVGARDLMGLPDGEWQRVLRQAVIDPKTRISVTLDGVDDLADVLARGRLIEAGAAKFGATVKGIPPKPLDWEIYLLRESGAWRRADFYRNGLRTSSPVQFGGLTW